MKIGELQTGYPIRVLMNRMNESIDGARRCSEEAARLQQELAEQEGLKVGYDQRAIACRDALIALGVDIEAVRSGEAVIVGGE